MHGMEPEQTASRTYTCEDCGETFEYGWSDDDAHAESVENFGVRGDAPGMAIVCHDCYLEIVAGLTPRDVE